MKLLLRLYSYDTVRWIPIPRHYTVALSVVLSYPTVYPSDSDHNMIGSPSAVLSHTGVPW